MIETILKREIPQRKSESKGKVVISAIIIIIAIAFSSVILGIIGLLFFAYFYFVYNSGSLYSSYKVISKFYYAQKSISELSNEEVIISVVRNRNSHVINNSNQDYMYNSLKYLQKYINLGYFNYESEILVIYATAAGVWVEENRLPEHEIFIKNSLLK